ncbi:MAG: hypothetical protein U9N77_08515, partial [Thermodesulfobacteriota bacterium]|nr:hypothetical protein [Thermodesulfobacteriota bacterium]
DQVKYMSSIHDPMQFRNELEAFINRYPELFPNKIKAGYRLKESRLRSILMLCEQVKIGENGVLAEYL